MSNIAGPISTQHTRHYRASILLDRNGVLDSATKSIICAVSFIIHCRPFNQFCFDRTTRTSPISFIMETRSSSPMDTQGSTSSVKSLTTPLTDIKTHSKSGCIRVDLNDWEDLKSKLEHFGNYFETDVSKDEYHQTIGNILFKIENNEIERIKSKESKTKKPPKNVMELFRASLISDDDVYSYTEVPTLETVADKINQLKFLNSKLSNPRSIQAVYHIGSILHNLKIQTAKTKDFYEMVKTELDFSKAYISFFIDAYLFINMYKKMLLSTYSVSQFRRDFSCIKKAFEKMSSEDKAFWI